MIDTSTLLTLAARSPEPYIHLDNRGLVLCNGPRSVLIPAGRYRWVTDTLAVIADEGRATRTQGDHVFGGFATDDAVILYAGVREELISLGLEPAAFEMLRQAMSPQ
jgi:hypothetical protein